MCLELLKKINDYLINDTIMHRYNVCSFSRHDRTWLSKRGEVGVAVDAALREGYRHIDCAHLYNNEAEVGEAVQKCVKDGVIERDDIFITSKLWYENIKFYDTYN